MANDICLIICCHIVCFICAYVRVYICSFVVYALFMPSTPHIHRSHAQSLHEDSRFKTHPFISAISTHQQSHTFRMSTSLSNDICVWQTEEQPYTLHNTPIVQVIVSSASYSTGIKQIETIFLTFFHICVDSHFLSSASAPHSKLTVHLSSISVMYITE